MINTPRSFCYVCPAAAKPASSGIQQHPLSHSAYLPFFLFFLYSHALYGVSSPFSAAVYCCSESPL